MDEAGKILVLGYGNPARGDDGLGPALIAGLEQAKLEQLELRLYYQLCVEDAMDIGRFAQVLFVDASATAPPPFELYALPAQLQPKTFDSHSLSPEALMFLARTLFDATTPARVLAIRGYRFEPFIESLSADAADNLQQALRFLVREFTSASAALCAND